MAKKKVDITLSVKTQFENMAAEIEKYKKSLKNLKVEPFDANLKAAYSDQIKEVEKLLKKINNFKLTTQNAEQFNSLLNSLKDNFSQLPGLFNQVNQASSKYYDNSISKIKEEINAEQEKIKQRKEVIEQLKEQFKEQNKVALTNKTKELETTSSLYLNSQKNKGSNKEQINSLKTQIQWIDKAVENYKKITSLLKDGINLDNFDFSKSYAQVVKYLKDATTTQEQWNEARKKMVESIGPNGAKLVDTNNLKELKLLGTILNNPEQTKTSLKNQLDELTGDKFKNEIKQLKAEIEKLKNLLQNDTFTPEQQQKITAAEKKYQEVTQKVEDLNEKLKQLNQQSSQGSNNLGNQMRSSLDVIISAVQDAKSEINEALKLDAANNAANSIDNLVKQFFGFQMVVDIGRKALSSFKETMIDLDTNLTSIAAVTGRTREEMWGMVDTYNEMAQRLGTTTSQIAESAKLYYQQGRNDAEVTKLVEQTAVLATTAEIEYADATNYLTAAVNGFKMEAEDAVEITDAWSALAADAAVDVKELAESISKVASLAENSGMTLETTSAFLTQMINFATCTRVA